MIKGAGLFSQFSLKDPLPETLRPSRRSVAGVLLRCAGGRFGCRSRCRLRTLGCAVVVGAVPDTEAAPWSWVPLRRRMLPPEVPSSSGTPCRRLSSRTSRRLFPRSSWGRLFSEHHRFRDLSWNTVRRERLHWKRFFSSGTPCLPSFSAGGLRRRVSRSRPGVRRTAFRSLP